MTATMTVTEDVKLKSLELFQSYQKNQSIRVRNQLLQLNFGLVRKEAHYWHNQSQASFDDLLQVGSMGLLRAIERFNPEKGNAFSSFAIPYIRGEIQHYLRDKVNTLRIPRRWLELRQKALGIIEQYQKDYKHQPSDQEIADQLGISQQEWQEIKLAYQNREPLSLDLSVDDELNGRTSLGDLVPDSKYRSFELAQEDQFRLNYALNQLEDQTRKVLEFVFLQDLTQKETADVLGISVITVARRLKKGVNTLKELMLSEI
jgi:RNA polymerase sigma-B factor